MKLKEIVENMSKLELKQFIYDLHDNNTNFNELIEENEQAEREGKYQQETNEMINNSLKNDFGGRI